MQLDLLFERLMFIVCELVWDHKFATCLLIIKKCETILGKCTFSSNEYFKESHNMIFYTRSSHNMCCSCVKHSPVSVSKLNSQQVLYAFINKYIQIYSKTVTKAIELYRS